MQKIYIACIGKTAIIVYEAEPSYTQLEDIVIQQLTYPRHMVACNIHKCLYVSDRLINCVFRVDINNLKIDNFIEKLSGGSYLSMMEKGNLLVMNESSLGIYTPDGNRCQTINLPAELFEPHVAIATDHQTFLISHGESCDLQRICEITPKGEVIRVYGSNDGSGKGQLDCPVYMSLDNEGRVIVLDALNLRCLLLDSKLRLLRVLVSRSDGIDSTLRMSYVKETGNLLIGTLMTVANSCVDIYSIRNVCK